MMARAGLRKAWIAAALAAAALAGVARAAEPAMPDRLMTWADLYARPQPAPPPLRIAYGADPLQFAELWRPPGAGPFPVVVMVHGGCWRTNVAKVAIMAWAAADLRDRGIAVWNLEYRGVDRPGGGYPGTFQDVAAGADALRAQAQANHLDLNRVVALGHSAGGHLAFWLAARPTIPASSPLHGADPLRLKGAVSLGGLPDLAAARAAGDASCGAETIDRLVGAPRAHAYADTSPAELPAPPVRMMVINGDHDTIAPPAMGQAYAARTKSRGGDIGQQTVAHSGHAELIAPGTAAWGRAVEAVQRLLAP